MNCHYCGDAPSNKSNLSRIKERSKRLAPIDSSKTNEINFRKKHKMSIFKDITNQRFGKLIVISRSANIKRSNNNKTDTAWLCRCDCGMEKIIRTKGLKSTRSCGCLIVEQYKKYLTVKKYSPTIASARYAWRDNGYNDEIEFDDFYRLSQMNCYYCDNRPSNKHDLLCYKNRSEIAKNEGEFTYNGLDRVDSSKTHSLDNVVTSCYICNRAKRELSINKFMEHIDRLIDIKFYNNDINLYREKRLLIDLNPLKEKKYFNSCVKTKFRDNYNDGDLSLEIFYQLTQLNCFYCGIKPSNINKINTRLSEFAKMNNDFIYSGLDRINCKLKHDYDNVIPCCKYCNYAKRDLNLSDFELWIKRLEKQKAQQLSCAF